MLTSSKVSEKLKNKHYLQKLVEQERKPVGQHFLSDRLGPASRNKAHSKQHALITVINIQRRHQIFC